MTKRLRTPDYVAGLGGLLLFVSLFAPWYTITDGTSDGWRSLQFIDLWLLITALAAMALPVITGTQDDPSLPIKWDVLTAWAGLITILLILYRVLSVANAAFTTGRSWGVALAAVAALITFAGCWWAMREQSAPGLRTPPEVRSMPTPAETDPTQPPT